MTSFPGTQLHINETMQAAGMMVGLNPRKHANRDEALRLPGGGGGKAPDEYNWCTKQCIRTAVDNARLPEHMLSPVFRDATHKFPRRYDSDGGPSYLHRAPTKNSTDGPTD